MYEIFAKLLNESGLKAVDVTKATGISSTVFSEWKKGKSTPKIDKLQKIADYFDVSTDYLSGKTDIRKPVSSEDMAHFEAMLNEFPIDTIKILSRMCKNERINLDLTEKFVSAESSVDLNDYLDFENNSKNIGTDNIIKLLNFYKYKLSYIVGYLSGSLIYKHQSDDLSTVLDRLLYTDQMKEIFIKLSKMNSEELDAILKNDIFASLENKEDSDLVEKMKSAMVDALRSV